MARKTTATKEPAKEKKTPGRPATLDNVEKRRTLLTLLGSGVTLRGACAGAGTSETALARYLLKADARREELGLSQTDVEEAIDLAPPANKTADTPDVGPVEEIGYFGALIARARDSAELRYVKALATAAQGGALIMRETVTRKNGDVITTERYAQPDVRAAQFMLERRNPEYRQKVGAELTGKGGGPVLVVNPIMPAGFSPEEPDVPGD